MEVCCEKGKGEPQPVPLFATRAKKGKGRRYHVRFNVTKGGRRLNLYLQREAQLQKYRGRRKEERRKEEL